MSIITSPGKEDFLKACNSVRQEKGIGTLGEKTLHNILKNYYEPHQENHEIKVGGFVADIVGEKGIIEIQTRNFSNLRKKLKAFLEVTDVIVVYPVAQVKWLCWIDSNTGEITKKRKSPKKGRIQDIFYELYKIKEYINHENFHLSICMLELTEYRYLNGWSNDRKRGSTRCDRVPSDIFETVNFDSIDDYKKFIPDSTDDNFTSKDFAKQTQINLRYAQTGLNILNYIGAIKRTGKKGRSFTYTKKDPQIK